VRCRSNCAVISTEEYSPSLPDPLLRTSVAFGGEDGIGISAKQNKTKGTDQATFWRLFRTVVEPNTDFHIQTFILR
jgi:hypothetical protein